MADTPYGRQALASIDAPDPFGESLTVLAGKDKDAFTLIVDGLEIPVIAGRVVRRADAAVTHWTATIPFFEDDEDLYKALTPYTYPETSVYLGGQLICSGRLYVVAPSIRDEQLCELHGASYTAETVSTADPPYEQKNVTLEKRAKHLVGPLDLKVVYDSDDRVMPRATICPTQSIFHHLATLAAQYGILINDTPKGELHFIKAQDVALGEPVGTIEENKPPCEELSARFDGNKRFYSYRVLNSDPTCRHGRHKNVKVSIALDPMIPLNRQITIQMHDVPGGVLKSAAERARSKEMLKAIEFSTSVIGWYAPNDKLWRENTLITIKSKTLYVPDGYDFLIRAVEYHFDEKGTKATLELVPPQVYTGEPIDEPWADPLARKSANIDRLVSRAL
jgi:prophage tail gpP-like protein